jgi:hypothetical protein
LSFQRGRNSGVTGLIDLPGVGAKFQAKLFGYKHGLSVGEKPRLGRGSTNWQGVRPLFSAGTFAGSGKVRLDGFPIPDSWKGQTGTITVQFHTGVTETIPICLTAVNISLDEKTEDQHDIAFTARVTADPTWAGWAGTQPSTTDPAPSDQEQYQGTSKTIDPLGLQSAATRTIDVWGNLADTDGAEQQRLANVIAAATLPFAGMKLRKATFQRDSLDGGVVLIEFGLTTTAEDVVNPPTITTLDPNRIETQATAAAINATPATPAGDAAFVLQTESTNELNDGNLLHTAQFGLLDSKEKDEFPNTFTGDDPYDLADTAQILRVHNSATPPADPPAPVGELVDRRTIQINRVRWHTIWTYANLNSKQKIEFPPAEIATDPSALGDSDVQCQVTDSSTPPATPTSRFTDGKLRMIRSTRVGGTPEKWRHIWEFGRRTTADDVTMPETVTTNEVSDIEDQATITLINSSSTPPAAPTAPVGQLIAIRTEQIHGSDGGKWKHTFSYANTTALQRIQFPTDYQESDPSQLEDQDHQSQTTGSSTVPTAPAPRIAGLVLRTATSVRIAGTPEKWLHRWHFARRSSEEDITYPGSVKTDEVSDIADDATITLVNNSQAPPATPTAPLGQLLEIRSERLTDAGKWKHTFHFGNTTALQRIQFPTDVLETDPSALRDEDHQSAVTGSSTVPTTPATRVPGLVLRVVTSHRISGTPEQWLHQWEFGRTSTAEDITFPGTVTQNDVGDLQDHATITLITASATPPATPAAPLGQLTETRSEQLTDAGKWKHTFTFENTTSVQKAQFPSDKPGDDPQNLEDFDLQALVTTSATPPAAPASRITGLKLRRITSQRVSGTPAQYLHIWEFGRRNTQEDVEFPATITDLDVYSIDGNATITRVTGSSTPPATPASPLGECVTIETLQIHAGSDGEKWRHTFKYAQINSQQRYTFPENVATIDPQDLTSTETQAIIDQDPNTTDAPNPTGLEMRARWTRQVSGTPAFYLHVWQFGVRNTKQDIEFPGTQTTNEISDIADEATITLVTNDSAPPADPGAPLGQLLEVNSERLTSDPVKWRHTFRYGNTTALQHIQFPTDVLESDPLSSLADDDQQSDVTATSTPPATPAPRVAGLVLRSITSTRIAGTPEKWLHRWKFGRRSTAEDITFPGTVTSNEVSDIADEATITLLNTSSTPPATPAAPLGQLLEVTSEQLTDVGKWKHTFRYGNTTALQKIQFPTDTLQTDPSLLQDEDQQSATTATSTPPATPSPRVAGLVLRWINSVRIAGTPEKWLHRWRFGHRSTKDDVEMPETETIDDPLQIADSAKITKVTASPIPAAPPTLGGYVYRTVRSEQLHPTAWKHTYTYALRTTQGEIEQDNSDQRDDPSDLIDEAKISTVTASSTPPATPAAPLGTKYHHRDIRQLNDVRWLHTFVFRRRNSADDVTMPDSITREDPYDLEDGGTVAIIADSANPVDSAPYEGLFPNAKLIRFDIKQLHDTKWEQILIFGPRSTKDDIEMPGTGTGDDPQDIIDEASITQQTGSATPPSTPAAPVGTKLYRTTTRPIKDNKWAHRFDYRRRSSKDEIEFDGTITRNDPSGLDDTATITIVQTSATPPAIPSSPDADAVHVGTDAQQIHDTKWKFTFHYGPRTSQQAVEMDGTVTIDDPADLQDDGTITQVTTSGTPPATPTAPTGTVLRKVRTRQLKSGRWAHTFEFGERTTQQDVEFEGTRTTDDQSDIADSAEITQVTNSATSPATPAAPVGTKVVEIIIRQLTTDRWSHTFKYARRNREDDIEMDQSALVDDQSDLEDSQRVTQVTGNSTPPTAPTAPANTKLISITTKQVHDTKWQHTWLFGPRSSKDDIEMPATVTVSETGLLAAKATIAQVTNSATPPATPAAPTPGVKLAYISTVPVKDNRWKHTFHYETTSPTDDVQMGGTVTTADPQSLQASATITIVNTSGTAPAIPTAPTDTVHRETRSQQLNDNRWKHTFIYAARNTTQDVEFEGTASDNDPDDLRDGGFTTIVNSSSTPPATPAAPGTSKLIETRSQQLTNGKWKHTFKFGPRTAADEITMEGTATEDDPDDLADEGRIVLINSSSTPPGTPAAPLTGLLLRGIQSRQIKDNKYAHTFYFARRTRQNDIEFDGTISRDDQGDIQDSAEITHVTNSGTPPAADAAPVAGTQIIETITQQIHATRWKHTFRYAVTTTKQRMEFDATVVENDPTDLQDRASIGTVTSSATPPADPGTPLASCVLVNTTTKQITPTRWLHRFDYAVLTNIQKLTFAHTVAVADPVETFKQDIATVVTDASDIGTYLTNTYNALKGTSDFDGIEVKPLPGGRYELITKKNNADKIWRGQMWSVRDTLLTAGTAVKVADVISRGSSGSYALVVPIMVVHTVGHFRLRRRLIASAFDGSVFKWANLGSVNNAPFLGLPTNTVRFAGTEILANAGLTGSRIVVADFSFDFDTQFWFNVDGVSCGWFFTTGSPTIGFNSPSVFGWTVTSPTATDFVGAFFA